MLSPTALRSPVRVLPEYFVPANGNLREIRITIASVRTRTGSTMGIRVPISQYEKMASPPLIVFGLVLAAL